jgi:hypothetical protein
MTTIVTMCRTCGSEFTPDRQTILAGSWRTCPACRPAATPPPDEGNGRCERCGRALRTKGRTICLSCLGVAAL